MTRNSFYFIWIGISNDFILFFIINIHTQIINQFGLGEKKENFCFFFESGSKKKSHDYFQQQDHKML